MKIYLDFDGQQVSGTAWNNRNYTGAYNTGAVINAPAFSTDTDLANFSGTELATIQEVWARVSEDFAVFQVDVTTQEPPPEAFAASSQAIRVVVSTNVDSTSNQIWFPNAGGVAYLNSWYWSDGSPVWVFSNMLGNGFAKYVAEAASHEVGHAFNLGHDGRVTPSEVYYEGHGSSQTGWAPIMGVGYYKSLVQWSSGEYVSANNKQNDLNIINNALPLVMDDHGNDSSTATLLAVGTTGAVASSGLITHREDKDAFKFATQSGSVTINVDPFDFSSGKNNLDVELSLMDSAGTVLATINPSTSVNASLTTTLTKGFYTIIVDGIGKAAATGDEGYSDYASLGKFSVSGTVIPNQPPIAASDTVSTGSGNSILINVLANDSDPNLDVIALQSVGAPSVGSASIESGKVRYTPPAAFVGVTTFLYTIADQFGATSFNLVIVNVVLNSAPTLSVNQAIVSGNEGSLIANSGTSGDSDVPANVVTLTASIGSILKNANGTWNWSFQSTDDLASTNVVITADDGLGGIVSLTFALSVSNVAPTIQREFASVSGDVLSTITNSGTFNDVPADTVSLSASFGSVTKNVNGTWTWSHTPSGPITNQSVAITAQDDDGGTSAVSFLLNARVTVSNGQVFYRGSSRFGTSLDGSKIIAKASSVPQSLGYANVLNTSFGINGITFSIPGLASSNLSAADFAFRMSPHATTIGAPSTWLSTVPALSGIFVDSIGTTTTPAKVRLEWASHSIANRWLQVQVLANARTGLLSPAVFYVGHLQGLSAPATPPAVNSILFVTTKDVSAVLPVGGAATITSTRDMNKDGFLTTQDVTIARSSVTAGRFLRLITIPISGSADEGSGNSGAAPPFQPGAPSGPEGPGGRSNQIKTSSVETFLTRGETAMEFSIPLLPKELQFRIPDRIQEPVMESLDSSKFGEKLVDDHFASSFFNRK